MSRGTQLIHQLIHLIVRLSSIREFSLLRTGCIFVAGVRLMKMPRSIFAAVAAFGLFSVACFAQTQPDNTAQNKDHAVTADSQSHARSDRMTTHNVRKAIVADKSLSAYAHNVKVITVNGAVTLKGPVRSEEEKQKVQADAANVVSADSITNELTVKE